MLLHSKAVTNQNDNKGMTKKRDHNVAFQLCSSPLWNTGFKLIVDQGTSMVCRRLCPVLLADRT